MKRTIAALIINLGLWGGTPLLAQETPSSTAERPADNKPSSTVERAQPTNFSDDLCWVAPEWRDN